MAIGSRSSSPGAEPTTRCARVGGLLVHVENAIRRAREALAEDRLDDAEQDLLAILELDEREVRALSLLGQVAHARGEAERALALYERALEAQDLIAGAVEPAPVATPTLAELYAEQGYREAAAAVYRDLLAGRPEDGRVPEWRTRLAALSSSAPSAEGSEAVARLQAFVKRLEHAREVRRLEDFLARLGGGASEPTSDS